MIDEEDLLDTNERSQQMRIAAHKSWALTKDRAARTQAARRRSHHDRFVDAARKLHPTGSDEQIAKAAESLKKAHYREMALRSAQARRIRRQMADDAKAKRTEQLLRTAS